MSSSGDSPHAPGRGTARPPDDGADPVFTYEAVFTEDLGSPPPLPDTQEASGTHAVRPSLRSNSAARLASDIAALVLSLVAATVTARLLGPAGKGYYSTLLLLAGIFVIFFSAGLGEAAIVLTGRGRYSRNEATSATMLATLALAVVGAVGFIAVTYLAVGAEGSNQRAAVLIGAALIAVNVQYNTTAAFLLAQERVVLVAVLAIVAAAVGTAAVWILVAVGGLGTAGALVCSVIGSGVALTATVLALHRAGVALAPRWQPAYLRAAFPFGASLQISNLLVMMTARVDLIFVYRLADAAEAGSYSVALTIGTIVASVPTALSYASFPRLAAVEEEEATALTAQLFRVGMLSAVLCGAAVAVASPVLIPLVFGEEYSPAVLPTLLLVPGGVLWSGQWILCRASAARGSPRPLLVSFVVSCLTMVALDLILIPPFGGSGAALASLTASAVGLLLSFWYYRRSGWRWAALVPRRQDVTALVTTVRRLIPRIQ